MSFFANQPNPTPASLNGLGKLAALDGFAPEIDLDLLRRSLRMDGTVSPDRLTLAARNAQQQLEQELWPLRDGRSALWQLDPFRRDVPLTERPDNSPSEYLYFRALCCLVGAELTERYPGYDSTAEGLRRAETLGDSIDDLRRDARWAIRDLLGQPRTTVELI